MSNPASIITSGKSASAAEAPQGGGLSPHAATFTMPQFSVFSTNGGTDRGRRGGNGSGGKPPPPHQPPAKQVMPGDLPAARVVILVGSPGSGKSKC